MAASASSSSSFLQMRDENGNHHNHQQLSPPAAATPTPPPPAKKRRNQPGNPSKSPYNPLHEMFLKTIRKTNPDAEVIALSPKTLMATNRFICEVCNKGFQREQNLQLHRRGHNLPWKLKQKGTKEVRRKVYLCPEPTCVHHDPVRALGDLTGIKKHYSRKHGEKKYRCDKCAKKYAVYSDWKAHSKTCGTKEYRCDCGTLFSRRDSFITHRAFCDALAQESARNLTTPSFSSIGSHLVGLSQMPAAPDQINQPHAMLRYGGGSRPGLQFDNLMGHAFCPLLPARGVAPQPPPPLFLHSQMQNNEESQQSPHGLMQLPQLHMENGNASSSSAGGGGLFNLSFFPGNGGGAGNLDDVGQHSGSGGEDASIFTSGHLMSMAIPSLYSSNPHAIHSPSSTHMSATALLQKAAQYGSTSSASAGATSLLKPFVKPPPDDHSFGIYGSSNNSNSHLQDLVNSIAVRGGSPPVFRPGPYTSHHDHQQDLDDHQYRDFNGNNNNKSNNNNNNPQGFSSLDEEGRLTRDFLGVGEIVRRSFDSQGKTINQGFGGGSFN